MPIIPIYMPSDGSSAPESAPAVLIQYNMTGGQDASLNPPGF